MMRGISEIPGINTTIAPSTSSSGNRLMNTGASRKFLLMPDSQPNASQIAYEAESGITTAPSSEAPQSPIANRRPARSPASGTSACAAASAELTCTPAGYSTVPVTTTMKNAKRPARAAPRNTSMRAYAADCRSTPLSTPDACTEERRYGVIGVPTRASGKTSADGLLGSDGMKPDMTVGQSGVRMKTEIG